MLYPSRQVLRSVLISGAFCTLVLLFSCAKQAVSPKLETERLTLMYLDKNKDSDLGGITLRHPLSLTEEMVTTHLRRLRYEPKTLLGKVRPVFSKEDIKSLSRVLTKALRHAKPDKFIAFQVTTKKGLTAGDLFAGPNVLNWRFLKIRGDSYRVERWARREALWHLVPQPGQRYKVKRILFEKELQNWVEAKIQLPVRKKRNRAFGQVEQAGAPQSDSVRDKPLSKNSNPALERKLKTLKNLFDSGLIDEADYRIKRKELLDNLL